MRKSYLLPGKDRFAPGSFLMVLSYFLMFLISPEAAVAEGSRDLYPAGVTAAGYRSF